MRRGGRMCRRLAGNTLPGSALRGFTPARLPGLQLWLRADLGVTYVQGPVAATGTSPPAVTFAGTPASSTNTIVLTCTGAGSNTTATFSWTLNGIAQTPFTAAATVVLTGTGITATFPVGAYTNTPSADTYTSVVTATAIADQSGRGFNMTAGGTPAFVASDSNLNGRPSISFVGVQYFSSAVTTTLSQPFTLITVGYLSSSVPEIPIAWGPLNFYADISSIAVSAGTLVTATTALFASPCVAAGVISAGAGTVYANSSASALATGSCGTGAIAAQAPSFGGFAASQNMNLAEALVYNAALTTAQLSSVFAYCGARYGKAWS